MAVYTDSDADDFEDDLRTVLFSDQGRSAKSMLIFLLLGIEFI